MNEDQIEELKRSIREYSTDWRTMTPAFEQASMSIKGLNDAIINHRDYLDTLDKMAARPKPDPRPVEKTEREKFQIELNMLRLERDRLQRENSQLQVQADSDHQGVIDQRAARLTAEDKVRMVTALLAEITKEDVSSIEEAVEALLQAEREREEQARHDARRFAWTDRGGLGYEGTNVLNHNTITYASNSTLDTRLYGTTS